MHHLWMISMIFWWTPKEAIRVKCSRYDHAHYSRNLYLHWNIIIKTSYFIQITRTSNTWFIPLEIRFNFPRILYGYSFNATKGCIDFITLSLLQNSSYFTELKYTVARRTSTRAAYETQYCRCKRKSCMMDERGWRGAEGRSSCSRPETLIRLWTVNTWTIITFFVYS